MIDPNEFAQLNANAHQFYAQQAAAQPMTAAVAKPKGGFLSHLLPTAGGIGGGISGGAAGGALAGSAVLPGVGTAVGGLLGALLGGALGGAGGKVVENKIEGNSLGSGVGGQALEQGVLAAGPLRLLKGASAATGAIKGGTSLADALNAGGEAATAPGIISKAADVLGNKGAQMEARAGGFGIGEKVSGQPPLGFYDSAKIAQNLRDEGISAGAPETRLKQVEDTLANRGKQIDTTLTAHDANLTPAASKAISGDFLHTIEQQPGVTDAVRKSAANLAANFENQVKDVKGIVNFRRGLDNQVIAFNRNPDAKMAADQLAARTFRNVLSDTTDKLAPGVADLNKSYSNLMNAKEFLVGGAKAVSDQSQSASGGLIGRLLANDTAQAAKSKGGQALQDLTSKVTDKTADPFGAKAIATRSLPLGVVNAAGSALPPLDQSTSINSSADTTSTSNINPTMDPLSQTPDQMSSNSPFDPANVETNIEKIIANGGNMKDVTDYVSLASAINGLQQSAAKANAPQQLNATQQQLANNANSGLSDIQALRQMIGQNPSIAAKDAIPGGGLARRLTGTTDYEASKQNIIDVISRLRSGAAISASEEKLYKSLLPGPADSAQSAASKLDRLHSLLSSFANPQPAASATDLVSALGGA